MTLENIPKKLIYLEIIYNCFIKFLVTDFHFPGALNYVSDLILIALVLSVLYESDFELNLDNSPLLISLVLLAAGTVSSLLSYEGTVLLYAWSFRNTFRLFVFFYCCCEALDMEDLKNLFGILTIILYMNIGICAYEYFVRGMEYDFLGGTFGNGVEGGNGPLNALMIVSVTYLIIEYINKRRSIFQLLFGIGGSLFIATVGELKIFYFELILLIFLVSIFVTKNMRMVVFLSAAILIGVIGMSFYVKLYPHRAGFLSLAFVKQYSRAETYGVDSHINRLSAIRYIWRDYFEGDLKKVLFGLGMGNGEVSAHGALTSPFYRVNGATLRYDWFSHAFIFVEFGITGLILYISFFASSMLKALRNMAGQPVVQAGFINIVFIIMMIFYNQVLRIESFCYLAAFVTAVPVLAARAKSSQNNMSYVV